MAVQMTRDQLQQLINAMANGRANIGSFADCPHRFNGARNHHKLEEFISKITIYKQQKNIDDAMAIQGLTLLLEGSAANWWSGIKHQINTWQQVETALRQVYSPPKANWMLLNEINNNRQNEDEPTDAYISRQRTQLARLNNYPLNEQQQIDLIYGHIRLHIRKEIPRDTVQTFTELLAKARIIEQYEYETKNKNYKTSAPIKHCSHCNITGHTVEECYKKKNLQKQTNELFFTDQSNS